MALLVLIVITLATLARLDIRQREALDHQRIAREQAWFALELALAELTETLGPDQRISARADLLNSTLPRNRYWTGVWDFTATGGGRVHWLVSGDDSPQTFDARLEVSDLSNEHAVWMLWRNTTRHPDAFVPVPIVKNQPPMGLKQGRYAYWVGDEGIKASILTDPLVPDSISGQAVSEWMQRGNPAHSPESLLPQGEPSFLEPAASEMLSITQLPMWMSESSLQAWQQHRHDLTALSFGLLTNPAPLQGGGLKRALDDSARGITEDRHGDVFSTGAVLSAWQSYPAPDSEGRIPLLPISAEEYENLDTGSPYASVIPILAEVIIRLAVYDHWVRKEPAVRFNMEAEFFNPYTRPLVLNAPGSNDKRALSIRLSNAPWLEVENHSTGMLAGPVSLDSMPGSSGVEGLVSWMEFDTVPGGAYAGRAVLLAGETYRLQEPDPALQPMGLVKYTGHRLEVDKVHVIEARVLSPAGDRGSLDFSVHWGREGEGLPLWEMRGIPYEADSYLFYPPLDEDVKPYMTLSTAVRVDDMFTFAFHYGLGIGRNWMRSSELGRWRDHFDLRRPFIEYDGSWQPNGETVIPNSTFIRLASIRPVDTENNISEVFPGTDWLYDAYARDSAKGTYSDIRLYDVPVGRPLSLADFRHLPFKDLPPEALGSPTGDILNTAFDRYFLVAPWNDTNDLRPGTSTASRLQYLPDDFDKPDKAKLFGPLSAVSFKQKGAFNWNSTSEEAWIAVLTQTYADHGAKAFPAVIFRHNLGAQFGGSELRDEDTAFIPDGDQRARQVYFRQGIRVVDPGRIEHLARAIVAELRSRERPFASLAEFMNAGVFERALIESGFNTGYPEHANGYVSQSDLVAQLIWGAAVRSDTFIIRAYGDCVNTTDGQVVARAALEALVSRDYAFLDSRLPFDAVSNSPRRFQILYLRWLDPYTDW